MPDVGPNSLLEDARLAIAHLRLAGDEDVSRAVVRASEISARTLDVARVGVWILGPERRSLMPFRVFDLRAGMVVGATVLPLGEWPVYTQALESRRTVVANDAQNDSATSELTDAYLVPNGITAMLDAPIFLRGDVWGIVCHEHIGAPREWTRREIDFATSVADMLSALFEQAQRLGAEYELRRSDALVARARKDEALVRMSAGVGHDFATLLQTITLLSESASYEADEAERARLLRDVLSECKRGARLARRLLEIGRREVSNAEAAPIDLSVVLSEMRSTLGTLVGPGHQLEMDLPGGLVVSVPRVELEQIITNLVTNARDAMPEGGTVDVATRALADRIEVEVRDHGSGIDADTLSKIFEPFFTTKTAEKGSGMGLATVRAIAQSRGGEVDVFSTPGRGTTFVVTLPRALES